MSYFDSGTKDFNDVGLPSIMDGLFIPKIENVRTVMFHCNAVKKEDIEHSIRPYIKPNEEVKCLLLFSTKDLSKSLFNLLKYLLPELVFFKFVFSNKGNVCTFVTTSGMSLHQFQLVEVL